MTDKERSEFIKILDSYAKKAAKSKTFARKLLVNSGIYTKKGNLRNPYKNLHIK